MNCHKNISEVAETTATEEHSKAFYDGEIAKLYDAVGWDKSLQKYTGKTKPVKWVRIHNLPDFAYWTHRHRRSTSCTRLSDLSSILVKRSHSALGA